MPNKIYSNTEYNGYVTISAGQNNSNIFSCINLSGLGTAALRRLTFQSGWTTSNVSFEIAKDENGGFSPLSIFDGLSKSPLIIPSCTANETIPLIPYWFDSVVFFRIISAIPQSSNVEIMLSLQPIYQGIA